jgi:hypothetical protein
VCRCEAFGGERPVERGSFNLLVEKVDAAKKQMLYRLHFRDPEGRPLTLSGHKEVIGDPASDPWRETTTLYTRILRGHVEANDDAGAESVAEGIITVHLLDFLKQLTTFRVEGGTLAIRTSALARFGRLFMGKLWDVYGRKDLPFGPL